MSKPPAKPLAAEPAPAHRAPTLRQLRSFQAVARAMSFRQAAEALSLTQPALSASIRELEAVLGAPVLERSTHHVRLTPQGALLLPQARRHTRHASKIPREVDRR